MLIVGYDDHTSLVVVESYDEGVDGIDVQVICRFVQH